LITAEFYRRKRPVVLLKRGVEANPGAWARLQEAFARGIIGGSSDTAEIRADVFLSELNVLREIRNLYGQAIDIGAELRVQLQLLARDRRAREDVLAHPRDVASADLEAELIGVGFKRQLKPFQLENLAAILQLPHGADFSVPGAGKTSVALANFSLERARGRVSQLLVIAPIAAFQAWKEDSVACMSPIPSLAVHTGPGGLIPEDLDILLTNYNRVATDYDRIREYVALRPTQVILDEAHRMKRGEEGVHGRAVLDLAYAARRRDVLTGTPAPQGAHDLIAPIRFLYPGQDQQILPAGVYYERDTRSEEVLRATSAAITRYFVRTPKSTLNLPPTKFTVVNEPMGPIQRAIYDALLGRYRGEFTLDRHERHRLDQLGRIMMYLLEAATNPMLLMAGGDEYDQGDFAHPPLKLEGNEGIVDLLQRYRDYEIPWKYERAKLIVDREARLGRKVIVWSTFVRNIRALASYVADHEPAVVHGGVPPEDGAVPGSVTREAELERFRHDPSCHVLLANPAACGEGVSLHLWCHHAIYLDRTFNAGHFLQSQDRIHRLGLSDEVMTEFTILLSDDSIDGLVDSRLREKIVALGKLMNDPGLVQVALPESDVNHGDQVVASDDMAALVSLLRNGR
jgi:SNF2 family DNA or RNA helicase